MFDPRKEDDVELARLLIQTTRALLLSAPNEYRASTNGQDLPQFKLSNLPALKL